MVGPTACRALQTIRRDAKRKEYLQKWVKRRPGESGSIQGGPVRGALKMRVGRKKAQRLLDCCEGGGPKRAKREQQKMLI